ncbi:MAG TPA: hypothetical protein VIC26_10525 [Marinagarivorans sp.]
MTVPNLSIAQSIGITCLGLCMLIGLPTLASPLTIDFVRPEIQKNTAVELAMPKLVDAELIAPFNYRIYRYDLQAQIVQRDDFVGDIPLLDPAEPGVGVYTQIEFIGWDASGDLWIERAVGESSDAGYVLDGGREFAKYLLDADGRPFGLVSLVDGLSFTIKLDLSGDRSVDLMAQYDAVNAQIVHLVKDRADVLAEYESWMAGANAYCGAPNVEPSATPTDTPAFGALAPPQSRIDFCDAFLTQASGTYGSDPFHPEASQIESPPSLIDQACQAVLQQADVLPTGPVFQPPESTRSGEGDGSQTASTVGGALEKAGQALMDASSAGRASSGGCPQCGAASSVGYVLGGLIRGLGRLLDDPLPGEEGAVDWADYCQRRASLDHSFSLFELDKKMHERECPDPREAQAAAGRIQPNLPDPLAARNCRDPERVNDLNGYFENLHSQCEVDNTNADCSDPTVPRDNSAIDATWVDTVPANKVRDFELKDLPKVINPAPHLQHKEPLSKETLDKFGL